MTEFKQLSGKAGMEKIGALIEDIHIAMLTTIGQDGSFDSRPMGTQKTQFDGTLWFLTRRDSEKVGEIKSNSHVGLTYADPANSKYISMKGRADVSQDRAKIHELWSPMYKAWFPEGEGDPHIDVLRVDVEEAEYWEASSSKLIRGIKYLAAAATGGNVDVGEVGKVTF